MTTLQSQESIFSIQTSGQLSSADSADGVVHVLENKTIDFQLPVILAIKLLFIHIQRDTSTVLKQTSKSKINQFTIIITCKINDSTTSKCHGIFIFCEVDDTHRRGGRGTGIGDRIHRQLMDSMGR